MTKTNRRDAILCLLKVSSQMINHWDDIRDSSDNGFCIGWYTFLNDDGLCRNILQALIFLRFGDNISIKNLNKIFEYASSEWILKYGYEDSLFWIDGLVEYTRKNKFQSLKRLHALIFIRNKLSDMLREEANDW